MSILKERIRVSSGLKYSSGKTNLINDRRPLPFFGIVNIDNVSDKEFDLIRLIAGETTVMKVNWEPQSFLEMVAGLLSKNKHKVSYKAVYSHFNVVISKDDRGRLWIKISKGRTKRVLVNTFIPFKPENKLGKRTGTSRSMVLYNLFKTVRFQVDREMIAG